MLKIFKSGIKDIIRGHTIDVIEFFQKYSPFSPPVIIFTGVFFD